MGGVDALTNIDFTFKMLNQNIKVTVLAGWFNWLEYRPGQPKDVGLIPGQGSGLGCGFSPHSGCRQEATDRCFSPSLSPFLSL